LDPLPDSTKSADSSEVLIEETRYLMNGQLGCSLPEATLRFGQSSVDGR
jgi:hypothetical protein